MISKKGSPLKPYKVIFTQTIEREFEVEAHTPEEAEQIATNYLEDGEPGYVLNVTVEDAYVVENDEELAR